MKSVKEIAEKLEQQGELVPPTLLPPTEHRGSRIAVMPVLATPVQNESDVSVASADSADELGSRIPKMPVLATPVQNESDVSVASADSVDELANNLEATYKELSDVFSGLEAKVRNLGMGTQEEAEIGHVEPFTQAPEEAVSPADHDVSAEDLVKESIEMAKLRDVERKLQKKMKEKTKTPDVMPAKEDVIKAAEKKYGKCTNEKGEDNKGKGYVIISEKKEKATTAQMRTAIRGREHLLKEKKVKNQVVVALSNVFLPKEEEKTTACKKSAKGFKDLILMKKKKSTQSTHDTSFNKKEIVKATIEDILIDDLKPVREFLVKLQENSEKVKRGEKVEEVTLHPMALVKKEAEKVKALEGGRS